MNISVSNIAWSKGINNLTSFFNQLEQRKVKGVELALSCFWEEPIEVDNSELFWLRNELKARDLKLVSLHSLTYTRPDLEVFYSSEKRASLLGYLKAYRDIAYDLGCKNLVFGSPKSRVTYGKNKSELDDIFFNFLCEIEQLMDGLNFNIEPLSKNFCEYLNSFEECLNLLNKQEFQKIFIQLDVRTIIETKEKLEKIFSNFHFIKHVHAGNPGLKIPGKPYQDIHQKIRSKLLDSKYSGYISAEVASQDKVSNEEFINQIIDSMVDLYGK